jgi:uncharacterized protein (DUF4415 family)
MAEAIIDDDDAPELTSSRAARAQPAKDVLPEAVLGQFKRTPGRPKAERTKAAISIRLDADVIEYFRKSGPGWQTRINAALRRAIG